MLYRGRCNSAMGYGPDNCGHKDQGPGPATRTLPLAYVRYVPCSVLAHLHRQNRKLFFEVM
jgi:hypothetical protein